MFVLCPHCQFLVALLANGLPPERCPRCDGSLQSQGPAHAGSTADRAGAAGEAATATEAMQEGVPVAPRMAAEGAAPGSDGPSQDDDLAHVADADRPGETLPAPAVDEPGNAHATASGAHASPPTAMEEPGATEGTAVQAGFLEAEADSPAPAFVEPALVEAALVEAGPVQAAPAQPDPPPAPPPKPTPKVARSRRAPARKARNPGPTTIPSFARAAPVAKPVDRRRFWFESAAISVLSLLLAVQWLLADRARLAADADWRPLLSILCGMFGCELPAWREPLAFALVERDVRPHPQRAGALRVTATFRNDARWPQPWPGLLLTLSDIDGQVAGARVFTAREYLGAAPTQNELDSGQTASIAMDVVEPTPRIVAFTFDFR